MTQPLNSQNHFGGSVNGGSVKDELYTNHEFKPLHDSRIDYGTARIAFTYPRRLHKGNHTEALN